MPHQTRIKQMSIPSYRDKVPTERAPIANNPAPAQEFGRGAQTGDEAAVSRQWTPSDRRKE
jgi:hypothetical protein